MEPCTIIVDARDRFSLTTRCLETLIAHTREPYDLIVVIGGAPERCRNARVERFEKRARFIFTPQFLNQAQARNIGLRAATTRLAVVMDNDVFVRPGLLEGLMQCQRETSAVQVVPIILETERRIHTAGNSLYVTYENSQAFGHKELCYHGLTLVDGSNLKRERVDYGELHCQLVEVEPTLRLNAFDEHIQEVGEIDSGLTWSRAGYEMWFEPSSVVCYQLYAPIAAEDIRLFAWRWDMRLILEGYRYFQQKWNMDITEHGTFREFLLNYNSQLGMIPRMFPSESGLRWEKRLSQLWRLFLEPFRMLKWRLQRYHAQRLGYFEWAKPTHK